MPDYLLGLFLAILFIMKESAGAIYKYETKTNRVHKEPEEIPNVCVCIDVVVYMNGKNATIIRREVFTAPINSGAAEYYKCNNTHFMCANKRCINTSLLCNKVDDCGDNSDEDKQHARCPEPIQLSNGIIAAIVVGCIVGAILICCWVGTLIDCIKHMYKYWCSCCRRNYHTETITIALNGQITHGRNGSRDPAAIVVTTLPPSYSSIFRNEALFQGENERNVNRNTSTTFTQTSIKDISKHRLSTGTFSSCDTLKNFDNTGEPPGKISTSTATTFGFR